MATASLFAPPKKIHNSLTIPGDSKLTTIMTHLQMDYMHYKYTVYRCSSKFVTLQKVLFTSNIPYKLVVAVLERHGIRQAEGNLMVPPFQLTSLIHDIYLACEKLGHFSNHGTYNLEVATSVLSNFFWNIFDPNRRHSISLLEIKITFLLLCKFVVSDQLVTEFFNLLCDAKSKCVSKLSFASLLTILTKIFTYIGEGNGYGSHNIQKVMEQCFERCHNTMGLTEYQFHCLWSTTQTRFLIYGNLIALIKRIEDTEKLIHNNVCASCHSEKIIGIRFKCQTCTNLSLCLKCFATGYSTNKHEAGHRMYEVFSEDLPPKKFSHYFAKLCNLFLSKKNSEETKGFCNANDTSTELVTIAINRNPSATTTMTETVAGLESENINKQNTNENINNAKSIEPSLTGLTNVAFTTCERLQTIINRLYQQNTKLELQLKCIKTASNDEISNFLTAHHNFLIDIINEMRNFSHVTHTSNSYPSSSTPNRSTITFAKKVGALEDYGNLTHSINGADINRSYLDANKSDYSLKDLSLWFNQRRASLPTHTAYPVKNVLTNSISNEQRITTDVVDMRDTEMHNFKQLLNKVKEIVEDSYSDNTELAEATQNLENVLDSIIKCEESRRKSA